MSRRRVTLVLAIMAALTGAPSSVSAAPPNQLSEARVAPAWGETSTLFVVSVRYVSPAGNPATTVTADLGGQVAVLALVSGTATDGMWRGTTTLPAGSWDVTLHASVVKGPQPILSAGTVSVGGATAEPSAPGGGVPSFGPGAGPGTGGTPSSPQPRPAATPETSPAASRAPARSTIAAAPSQPHSDPAAEAAAPAGPARRGGAPARSPRAKPSGSGGATRQSPVASQTTGVAPAAGREVGDLALLMVMGTLAVGMVALVGSAWVILGGRRDRRAATLGPESSGTDPGVAAAAIVEQRARRRARLRSADDPILAAMGLPDDGGTPRAARTSRGKTPRSRGRRRRPAR